MQCWFIRVPFCCLATKLPDGIIVQSLCATDGQVDMRMRGKSFRFHTTSGWRKPATGEQKPGNAVGAGNVHLAFF